MSSKTTVPDAWDDDWEAIADREEQNPSPPAPPPAKLSKAERQAAHAELNRKIWESAETPETFHYLAARNDPPLKTEFKPALKVLSRRPTPQTTADDGEEEAPKLGPTPEELRARAQKEREEKQRKYEEVRARLFGTDDSSSGREEEKSRGGGRGRGRGGRGRGGRPDRRIETPTRELYDPNYTQRPSRSGTSTPKDDEQVIRTPRGPSNTNSRGFANRGRG